MLHQVLMSLEHYETAIEHFARDFNICASEINATIVLLTESLNT